MSEPIVVQGHITFDEYYTARRYHSRYWIWGMQALALVVGAIALAVGVLASSLLALIAGLMLLVAAVLYPRRIRQRIHNNWEQYPSIHEPQHIIFSHDEIVMFDDDDNEVIHHWDKFIRWQEHADQFLLYVSPNLYLIIPTRMVKDYRVDDLRDMFAKSLPE